MAPRTRGGVTESYLTDALGSTLELRNAAQNQTVEYTYDPYGGTASSAASTNMIKYTGREQDLEDLYYYRNRYYKPSVGRFISEDPIGLAGGSNFYTYVGNNPLRWTDPKGECPWCIGAAIGGVASAVSAYNAGADLTDIGLAGLAGAIGGAISTTGIGALTETAGALSSALAGGVGGAIGNGLGQGFSGASLFPDECNGEKRLDWTQVAEQAAIGSASGAIGLGYTLGYGVDVAALAATAAAASGATSVWINNFVPTSLGGARP